MQSAVLYCIVNPSVCPYASHSLALCQNDSLDYGAHQKNLNEVRPILSAAKMEADYSSF